MLVRLEMPTCCTQGVGNDADHLFAAVPLLGDELGAMEHVEVFGHRGERQWIVCGDFGKDETKTRDLFSISYSLIFDWIIGSSANDS